MGAYTLCVCVCVCCVCVCVCLFVCVRVCVHCVQELEIVIGDIHISFTTTKIGSLLDCKNSK